MHHGRDPYLRWRLAGAAERQAFFQLLAAWTLQARAITAEGDKAVHREAVRKDLGQTAAHGVRDQAQGCQGHAGQGLLEPFTGSSRPAPFLVGSDVKSTGGLEAFRQRVARAPSRHQEDKEQRLGLPAGGLAGVQSGQDLFPELGCKKIT